MSEFMTTLVNAYGPISATLAADYYDQIRELSSANGRYLASPGGQVESAKVVSSSNWAAQPLFGEEPLEAVALARYLGSVQRYVQDYGRQSLVENAKRDPAKPRYARVPDANPCAFCRLLASRGAVYESELSAGERGVNDFHDDCDCQIVPSFADDDLPYDPQKYLNQYLDARETADTSNTAKILSDFRQQQGIH